MVDLTKKKTLAEYETGALANGDTVVTYRPANAVGEKVFLGNIVAGTAASIADGTSTALKMYSDKALKDAVNTGAIPIGTDTEIETGTDTIAKLYAPDQLNSAINSLIETAVPDGTKAQIIAGTDTTERKFTPADINGAVKDIAVAQYAGRTAMKAATGLTAGDVVYLSEGGRSGKFIWTLGDFSTEVAADTLQGVYVASDTVAATVGCWVRKLNGYVTPEMFGADPSGVEYSSDAIQAAINTNLNVRLSDGAYLFDKPVIVHDRAGLSVAGSGIGVTILTSDTTMALDGARIQALGFADYAEYDGRQCFFMITEYDGQNQRAQYSARQHVFKEFSVDMEGTLAELDVDVFSSPSVALTTWERIEHRYCNSLFWGWFLSDDTGNHYHLNFNECTNVEGRHHATTDFNNTSRTATGSRWVFTNNAMSNPIDGYHIGKLSYVSFYSCSIDNQNKGYYAYHFENVNGVTVMAPSLETRLEQAGVAHGGGIFKAVGSSGIFGSGLCVGGDRDDVGTGLISDFGVTDSLWVLDDSIFDFLNIEGDWRKSSASVSLMWPFYCKNGSVLRYHQGDGVQDTRDENFVAIDTSVIEIYPSADTEPRRVKSTGIEYGVYQTTGTFTPVIADASTGGNEATAGANGYYTVKGNQCTVSVNFTDIDTTGLTAGNTAYITGLPFKAANKAGFIRYSSPVACQSVTFSGAPMVDITDNNQYATIIGSVSGGTQSSVKISDISSGSGDIRFTITYEI